jgi:hypothetical protein
VDFDGFAVDKGDLGDHLRFLAVGKPADRLIRKVGPPVGVPAQRKPGLLGRGLHIVGQAEPSAQLKAVHTV